MHRTLPWVLIAVLLIAFVASFSELQRIRKRFGEVTRQTVHDHQEVRQFIIRADLAGGDGPIVIVGDSITEMARFPDRISGKRVVNAGIGGATILDYVVRAPKIFDGSKPSLIVVAIGANDTGSKTKERDFSALLSVLKTYAPLLVVDIPNGHTIDGIHPTQEASRLWVESVVDAIELDKADDLRKDDRRLQNAEGG